MGSVLLLYWRKLCEAFVASKKTGPYELHPIC